MAFDEGPETPVSLASAHLCELVAYPGGVGLYDVQELFGHWSSALTEWYKHSLDARVTEDVKEFERGTKHASQSKQQNIRNKI